VGIARFSFDRAGDSEPFAPQTDHWPNRTVFEHGWPWWASLASLWPRWPSFGPGDGSFTANPRDVIQTYIEDEESAPIEELHRDLSLHMHNSYIENRDGLEQLAIFFQIASGLLTIEVIHWIIASLGRVSSSRLLQVPKGKGKSEGPEATYVFGTEIGFELDQLGASGLVGVDLPGGDALLTPTLP
jgi:hypothetical protein